MKFKVQYYIKSNGEIPVLEFLDKLDKKMSAKMIRNIKLLEDNGNHLSMPYSESLSKGLFQDEIDTTEEFKTGTWDTNNMLIQEGNLQLNLEGMFSRSEFGPR